MTISTKLILSDNIYFVCVFNPKNWESNWACIFLPHVFTKAVWGTTSHRDENLPCVASHFYPWKRKHAKLLAPRPLPECRPPSHCGLPGSFHSSPVFTGYWRKHQLFTPPLCGFLLAPRCCEAGNHRLRILPSPFPEVPSSFLGSASLV